jgi:hypothetical protein
VYTVLKLESLDLLRNALPDCVCVSVAGSVCGPSDDTQSHCHAGTASVLTVNVNY